MPWVRRTNRASSFFIESSTIAVLVLGLFAVASKCAEIPCNSVNNAVGRCVQFEECPAFLAILKSPQISGAEIRLLQKLTCDFQNPKVCCPLNEVVGKLPPELQHAAANQNRRPPQNGQGHGHSTDTTSFTNLKAPSQQFQTNSGAHSSSGSEWNGESSSKPQNQNRVTNNKNTNNNNGNSYKTHPSFKLLPSIEDCGNVRSEDHIVGGKDASHGGHPWMARIGYRNTETDEVEFYCSATVISKRYVLTAAHCSEEIDPEYVPEVIRLGEHNTTTDEDCSPLGCSRVSDYKIEKIIAHPRYNTEDKFNDIGVIRVDRDIDFGSNWVRPICLPFKTEYNIGRLFPANLNGKKGLVAGWGRTKWNRAEGSTTLQEVFLPMLSNEECQSKYSNRAQISDKQMCAGGLKGKDSCSGDSGGPFIYPINFGTSGLKFVQLGVVSFGPVQCGIGGLPGVYARISSYFEWILDNMAP